LSPTVVTLKSLLIVTVPSPVKLTQAFAVLLATLSDSVAEVDSVLKVTELAGGVDENVPLVADVIRPLASTVMNGIADALPYVPAITPVVPSVPVPWLIVKSPARVVERLVIVPVVLLSVPIVPVVLFNVAIVPVVLAKLVIVPLVIVAAVEVVVPAVSVGIVPSVMFAVLEVRLVIVPVVIVALVLTVRLPVAVP